MYCHAVEMSAPQEFLANLLRILAGGRYHIKPFGVLGRRKKKSAFSWVPPSATTKYRELKRLALDSDQNVLSEYIDQFFNEDIRNAFSHSDYVISEEYFRWTENGLPQQLPLESVSGIVRNGYRFFSALLWLHAQALKDLKSLPRYHKWPNYEVLELLTNEEGLHGFCLHFSNDTKATFSRTEDGVVSTNVVVEPAGTVNFWADRLYDLRSEWRVDGKRYEA